MKPKNTIYKKFILNSIFLLMITLVEGLIRISILNNQIYGEVNNIVKASSLFSMIISSVFYLFIVQLMFILQIIAINLFELKVSKHQIIQVANGVFSGLILIGTIKTLANYFIPKPVYLIGLSIDEKTKVLEESVWKNSLDLILYISLILSISIFIIELNQEILSSKKVKLENSLYPEKSYFKEYTILIGTYIVSQNLFLI